MQASILRGFDKVEANVTVQERADDADRFIDMVRENSSLVHYPRKLSAFTILYPLFPELTDASTFPVYNSKGFEGN
jgi:hypothetical protein